MIWRNWLRILLYPLTMTAGIVLFLLTDHLDEKYLIATATAITSSLVLILAGEYLIPYNREWRPGWKDLRDDGIYLLVVQTVIPQFLLYLLAAGVLQFIQSQVPVLSALWPAKWPVGAQVILLLLGADLMRYWLHRLYHMIPVMWRFHAVHHSVKKLYWLNTSRFHPLEKISQFLLDVFPFILLGVPQEVLSLFLVVYAINGFFQHSNTDVRLGWLNYIISSPQLHRWHHSVHEAESNRNYGNNLIIYDLLFGTYFLPKNRKVGKLGLHVKEYPMDFWRQLFSPWNKKYNTSDDEEH